MNAKHKTTDPRSKISLRPTTRAKWERICKANGWTFTEAAERLAAEHIAGGRTNPPKK